MPNAEPVQVAGEHQRSLLNIMVQYSLITGLVLSLVFMVVGAIMLQLHPMAGATGALGVRQIPPQLMALNPLAFLSLGIILLMLTPAFRVVVAGIGYLLERDRLFAAVSLGVFCILVLSVVVGAG